MLTYLYKLSTLLKSEPINFGFYFIVKILKNKFFLIGNLVLLLIAIPLTLFFVKKQQELRSSAAPSSILSFVPANITSSTQCASFDVDVMVNPGNNIVSIVDFYITYDPTKLDVLSIKESTAFPAVVRATSLSAGAANMSVSVGADVTKAVQTTSKVATISFKPKVAGPVQLQFDSTKSRVFSLAPADQPTENVLSSATSSTATISSDACTTGSSGPTATPGPTSGAGGPNPTSGVGGGGTQPTSAPTSQAPICADFTVTPSSTGAAPVSVLFTAKGNDPDTNGLIAKTTFTFGDGQVQDVTDGMNLKNVSVQTNHTYQSGGTFNAGVVFTDNTGKVSLACNQSVIIQGTPSAQVSPTSAPIATTAPTAAPLADVPPSGGIGQTIGVMGAILLTVIGGLVFLAL